MLQINLKMDKHDKHTLIHLKHTLTQMTFINAIYLYGIHDVLQPYIANRTCSKNNIVVYD